MLRLLITFSCISYILAHPSSLGGLNANEAVLEIDEQRQGKILKY